MAKEVGKSDFIQYRREKDACASSKANWRDQMSTGKSIPGLIRFSPTMRGPHKGMSQAVPLNEANDSYAGNSIEKPVLGGTLGRQLGA